MSQKLMPYQVFINFLRKKAGKEQKFKTDESTNGEYNPEIADHEEHHETELDDSVEQVSLDESTEDQKNFDAPSLAKRKKMMILVGSALALVAAAFFMTSGQNPPPKPAATAETVQKTPTGKLPPQLNVTSLIEESARQEVQSEKAKRNQEMAALKKQIHQDVLTAIAKNRKSDLKLQKNTSGAGDPGVNNVKTPSQVGVTQYYPPPPQNGTAGQAAGQQAMMNPALPQQPAIGGSFRIVNGSPFAFEKTATNNTKETIAASALDASIDAGNTALDAGISSTDTYVPSGSFVNGMILTGADVPAPVGQSAHTDPYPILIHLTDDSFGPNRTHRHVKECFVVAAGKGDLSLERAIFRTSTLSCEYMDGSKLDTQIKGYIVDSDGRVGLRGKVITRNGSKIALTLLAGFGQGFGTAASAAGATQSITGAGIATSTAPSQVLKSSAFAGVGSAAGKLADYYGAMAKAIYPVIEVPAMRKVTIVVLTGFSLEPNIKKGK